MSTQPAGYLEPADPPPDKWRPDWAEIAQTLRADPGVWHTIFLGERASLATAVALNHISHLQREDGFEMKTANNTRGPLRTCDLYMRWNKPKRKRK